MRSCVCDGGVFVPARCFLWWSDVPLCALFVFAWEVGLLCGVCGPRFIGGCFGLGLWRGPWVGDIRVGCSSDP